MPLASNGRRRREYVKLTKRIAVLNAMWQSQFRLEPNGWGKAWYDVWTVSLP
jgi:hypothetical protein